jgi:hypothetical protein
MPALSGEDIQTLRDGTGAKVIEAVVFFVDGTGALRNATCTPPSQDGDQDRGADRRQHCTADGDHRCS